MKITDLNHKLSQVGLYLDHDTLVIGSLQTSFMLDELRGLKIKPAQLNRTEYFRCRLKEIFHPRFNLKIWNVPFGQELHLDYTTQYDIMVEFKTGLIYQYRARNFDLFEVSAAFELLTRQISLAQNYFS